MAYLDDSNVEDLVADIKDLADQTYASLALVNEGTLLNGMPYTSMKIPVNSDLNSYTTPGTYYVQSDANAETISHMPRLVSGTLFVINRSLGNYKAQVYISTTSAEIMYIRNYNAGTWTNWETWYSSDRVNGNFTKVETGKTATRAYSSGDGVIVEGVLYEVISNISIGDTFTVNTNVKEATTLDFITEKNILNISKTLIPSNSDLNDYITPNVYTIETDNVAATVSNIPWPESGKLLVIARQMWTYVMQIYIPSSEAPIVFSRFWNAGARWTKWSKTFGTEYVTVASNAESGSLILKCTGDMCILNFDDIKVGSNTLAFTNPLDSKYRPTSNANGCLYINSSKVGLIWISTDGRLHTTGVAPNDVLNGSLSWTA